MPIAHAHGFQVVQMAEAFVENGCEVEILAPRRVNPIKQDAFSYYNIKKAFSIKKLPCLDLIFLNDSNIFFWIQTITFLCFVKFYLLFKKYDCIYTREQVVGLFFNDFVFEVHSLPKKIKPFHIRIWQKTKRLVVLTPFIKERMVSYGISADKILVSSDGVKLEKFDIDLSQIEAREKLGLPKDKKLIGYVGAFRTLGMEKGLDIAIQSMTKLSQGVTLVLVGGHPADIEYYGKMSAELGVKNRVILVGRVGYNTVPTYLKAFDVLIAPFPETEHYSYYMSPMKIFEYMASKKPIVSTDLPSLRDIIGNGEALLVAPGSAEELAEGIQVVLDNTELREKMVNKAFTHIQDLTWRKRAKNILETITK